MSGPFSRPVLLASAAALMALAVYANALPNPFVYDDYRMVVGNTSIERLGDLRAIFWHDSTRPLINFSYALDRAFWGANPLGYHLSSVLLHALNVVLLFSLVLRLRDGAAGKVRAFATSALLAVHPLMTESVGYVSGRPDVLCTTFVLLALIAGVRWLRTGGAFPFASAAIAWGLALATKETAFVFPFVLLAIDLLDPRVDASTSRRRMWRCHVPLFGATILAGIVRLVVLARVEYPGGVAWHWSYVLLAVDVMRRYLFLLIVPAGQTAFHAVPDVALFSVAGVLAVAVLTIVLLGAWLLRRAEWLASVGLCWFVIALVPSSALIVGGRGEPLAEHRVYLASCGLFLAIGAGIGTWLGAARYTRRLRLAVSVGFGVVLAAFSAQTVVRNALWHDPVALWQEAVERAPTHYRPRLLLGEALQDAGRKTEALDQFRTAVRLRPSVPDGYVKIGVCLITMGRPSEARPYLLDALARDPDNEAARRALALADRLSRS